MDTVVGEQVAGLKLEAMLAAARLPARRIRKVFMVS